MKKLLCILLALSITFALAVPAFADMGPPVYYEYAVVVSNPDGARDNNKSSKIIPYQTKLIVKSEYRQENGVLLLSVKYNGSNYSINGNDVTLEKTKVGVDEAVKLDYTLKKVIINKNGAILREGPSESFDEVGKVPYGTILESNYASSNTAIGWMYVSQKNYNGWLYIYDDSSDTADVVATDEKPRWIETFDDNESFSPELMSNGIDLISLPKGIKLYYKYEHHGTAYIEYNGQKGWIGLWSYGVDKNNITIGTYQDMGLYTKADGIKIYDVPTTTGTGNNVLTTVPKDVLLYIDGMAMSADNSGKTYEWYRTTYNGKTGWISRTYDSINSLVIDSCQESTIKTEKSVYAKPDTSSTKIGTIPAGSGVKMFTTGSNYYYVKCGNDYGWVSSDNIQFDEFYPITFSQYKPMINETVTESTKKKSKKEKTTEAQTTTQQVAEFTEPSPESEEEKENESTAELEPKVVVLLCLSGAVVLALMAAIIVILVNKQKEDNQNM